MEKEENEGLPIQPIPTIKKRVKCLKCGAEMDVEFEIELAPLIPAIAGSLASMQIQPDKKEEMDDGSS